MVLPFLRGLVEEIEKRFSVTVSPVVDKIKKLVKKLSFC
jgi:hypothetical protein